MAIDHRENHVMTFLIMRNIMTEDYDHVFSGAVLSSDANACSSVRDEGCFVQLLSWIYVVNKAIFGLLKSDCGAVREGELTAAIHHW